MTRLAFMTKRTNGHAVTAASQPSPTASTPTHDAIAKRAYEIWMANGRPQGQAEQNWKDAEKQLRATPPRPLASNR